MYQKYVKTYEDYFFGNAIYHKFKFLVDIH